MSLRLTLICSATTQSAGSVIFPNDDPVSSKGEEALGRVHAAEFRETASAFFRPTTIAYTSPARAARRTADFLGLNAVVEDALRDCDHGRWAGSGLEVIQAEEPEVLAAWISDPHAAPHGGESVAMVVRRVGAWLDARTETGRVIAVTHPAIVRAAITYILEAPLQGFWRIDIASLGYAEFSWDGRRWAFQRLQATILSRMLW